ncbi:MAG: methionine synthase [Ruminococcaceae bacterium]|nr:methionine synthase [Oscillospiraceae bacterium]
MEKIKKEALIYLGYKNNTPDEKTSLEIDRCINEIASLKSAKYTYSVFDIEQKDDNIKLCGTNLILNSNDIKNHLKSSKKVAVLCVTLGSQVDFLINKYNKTNLSYAVLFDACATAFAEDVCDMAQKEISKIAKDEGFKITPRFSPGYGDFDIKIQSEIVKIANAQKLINLTVTKESVMIPTKSVTSLIGFSTENTVSCENKCAKCNMNKNCIFKREI